MYQRRRYIRQSENVTASAILPARNTRGYRNVYKVTTGRTDDVLFEQILDSMLSHASDLHLDSDTVVRIQFSGSELWFLAVS